MAAMMRMPSLRRTLSSDALACSFSTRPIQWPAIRQLNDGLLAFRSEIGEDGLAANRVEVAVVTFGPVNVVSGFSTIDHFYLEPLEASGATSMGMFSRLQDAQSRKPTV